MIEKDILEGIKKAVKDCGKIMLDANLDDLDIKNKSGVNNIVTKYDLLVQKKLKEELLKLIPDAFFLGEEEDSNFEEKKYTFIVDPIDGTTNFSRNLSASAISVALLKEDKPIIGVCYNPYTDELFYAKKGGGAYLNDKKISVSDKTLKEGLLLSGSSPYKENLRLKTLEIHKKMVLKAGDFRRFGSAVIELCMIASGRAEAYFELSLMPWDFAAASLILKEAGGNVTTIDGKDLNYFEETTILATNGKENYFKYFK